MPNDRMRSVEEFRVIVPDADGANRATVALVYEAVKAGQSTTEAGFAAIQLQLNRLADLPVDVGGLRERLTRSEARLAEHDTYREATRANAATEHERLSGVVATVATVAKEVAELKESDSKASQYRRTHLPSLLLAAAAFALSVLRAFGVG
jgi:hypothetical protein